MANKPITPEEMKAYVDATWEKCQAEAWQEPRQWQGLTEEEVGKQENDSVLGLAITRSLRRAQGKRTKPAGQQAGARRYINDHRRQRRVCKWLQTGNQRRYQCYSQRQSS